MSVYEFERLYVHTVNITDIDSVWKAREIEQEARNHRNRIKNEGYYGTTGQTNHLPPLQR
jgi:hypothetical protein